MIDQDNLSAEDVLRMMPAIVELWYKPFPKLRQMRRVAGYGPNAKLTKRQCILDILTNPESAQATDITPDRIAQLEGELRETKLQLAAANAGANSARAERDELKKYNQQLISDRDYTQEERDHVVATLRLLAKI